MAAVIDSVVMLVARSDSRTLDEVDSCAEPARSLKRAMDAEAQVANKRTHVEKVVSSGQLRTQENSCRVEAIVGSAENGSRLLTVEDLLSTVVDKAVKSDDAPAPVLCSIEGSLMRSRL